MTKRILCSLVSIYILLFSYQVNSAPVSLQTAKTVAENFFKQNSASKNVVAVLKETKRENANSKSFYNVDYFIFDITGDLKGFVIVAGDDIIVPILAYSTEGNFVTPDKSVGVGDWLNDAAMEIADAVKNKIEPNTEIKNQWAAYINGNEYLIGSRTSVSPLILTHWNQSPYYNDLCPFDAGQNELCVTGCVATTMAQIMKYWNYPLHGTGSDSYGSTYGTLSANFSATNYHWENMPFAIGAPNFDIAQLMSQCGISVYMNYSPTGSGAYVIGGHPSAQYSFVNYFGFNSSTIQGVQKSAYTSVAWTNLLKAELNAGRPVEYDGYGPNGGHTWVCDGYDANSLLHMNWGWGGADDGYFNTLNLSAGGTNFNNGQEALIGIQPPSRAHVIAFTSNNYTCPNDTVTLTAIGSGVNSTYFWQPTTGLSCPTCLVTTAHPTVTTTYSITKDSAGVVGNYHLILNVIPAPNLSYSANDPYLCSGESTMLNIAGGNTYQWSPATYLSCTTCQHPIASPDSTITYTVAVTNTNTCVSYASIYLNVSTFPDTPVVTLTGNILSTPYIAGLGYQWYDGNGSVFAATQSSFTPTQTGTYYLVVMNQGTCVATSNSVYVYVNGISSPENNHLLNSFFNGKSITIQASGINLHDAKIVLFNELGQVIEERKHVSLSNSNFEFTDVDELANGIYFISIVNGTAHYISKVEIVR